jgi:hypothetical protein
LPRTCLNFYYLKKEIEFRVANHDAVVLIDPRRVSLLLWLLFVVVSKKRGTPKVNNANFSDDKEADGLNAVDDDEEPRRGEMDDG